MIADDTEIRFMAPCADVSVLDGYCHGTGADRTHVMRGLLHDWAEKKLHEATVILRVAGRNPAAPADGRQRGGK